MTVKITKPALNLREELASLRNQGSAYEESKFYIGNLVTNGTFDTDLSGWTASSGTSLSVDTNRLKVTVNTGGDNAGYQVITTVSGYTYTLSATLQKGSTNGNALIRAGTGVASSAYGSSVSVTSTSATEVSFTFTATGTSTYITAICSNASSYAFFDNISVYEVAPNLVTNGTFDTDLTGWTAVNTGGQIVEQTGGKLRLSTTGAYIDANQLLTNVTSGKNYTISLDLTITSGQGLSLVINGIQTDHLSSGIVTRTYTSDGSDFIQLKRSGVVDLLIDNVIVTQGNHHLIHSTPYGYEVKDVYIDGDLAREGEAYDYTVHDGYIKPTIEPTATTETCLIGVRK